jgi:hypothetical protein
LSFDNIVSKSIISVVLESQLVRVTFICIITVRLESKHLEIALSDVRKMNHFLVRAVVLLISVFPLEIDKVSCNHFGTSDLSTKFMYDAFASPFHLTCIHLLIWSENIVSRVAICEVLKEEFATTEYRLFVFFEMNLNSSIWSEDRLSHVKSTDELTDVVKLVG